MELLPLAMTLGLNTQRQELHSALPDAAVVPDSPARPYRPRALRTRTIAARLLERTAHWIAPTPSLR